MPHRLLTIAQHINKIDHPPESDLSQPKLRSVINRAYYAAFLVARDFCEVNGYQGSGATHERVVDALIRQTNWRRQGNQLKQIKDLRHQADYKWELDVSPRDVNKAVGKSQEIIDALAEA